MTSNCDIGQISVNTSTTSVSSSVLFLCGANEYETFFFPTLFGFNEDSVVVLLIIIISERERERERILMLNWPASTQPWTTMSNFVDRILWRTVKCYAQNQQSTVAACKPTAPESVETQTDKDTDGRRHELNLVHFVRKIWHLLAIF